MFVKVCGVQSIEAATVAANNGVDLIGMIFVNGSKRQVPLERACAIVSELREKTHVCAEHTREVFRKYLPTNAHARNNNDDDDDDDDNDAIRNVELECASWFQKCALALGECVNGQRCPLFVGVFANQSVEEMNEVAERVGLDIIQLHGREGWDIAAQLCRPCIRVIHVTPESTSASIRQSLRPQLAHFVLLDTAKAANSLSGGTGMAFDWTVAKEAQCDHSAPNWVPMGVAGGLKQENVALAIETVRPLFVDTSSGVETNGSKDAQKIIGYINAARPSSLAIEP